MMFIPFALLPFVSTDWDCPVFVPSNGKPSPEAHRNWWRRRELNPRPHKRHNGIYARIPQLRFAMPPAHGQASGTAINLLILAPAPGCPARVASLLMTPDPPRRRKRSNVAELSREGQFVVGFCVFSRMFYEANRGPRRATGASTGTSKPVAPAIEHTTPSAVVVQVPR